jgi:hypothetical protein
MSGLLTSFAVKLSSHIQFPVATTDRNSFFGKLLIKPVAKFGEKLELTY